MTSSPCTTPRARPSSARATDGGPSAIEVDTCRFYGHHSGDAQLYRGKDEVKRLREERDCIRNFRRRVGEAGLLKCYELDTVDAEVAALIEQAVAAARAAPPPDPAALLTDVYVVLNYASGPRPMAQKRPSARRCRKRLCTRCAVTRASW